MNALRLSARIVERDALRHTPAGVPVVEFTLDHASEPIEAGVQRAVAFEIRAIAIGDFTRTVLAAPMGAEFVFEGFLARRSIQAKTLVFHVTRIASHDRPDE